MCIVCGSGTEHLLRAIVSRHAPARSRDPGRLTAAVVAPTVTAPLEQRDLGNIAGPADVILQGGAILTLSNARPTAEAISVRAGRIQAVGDESIVLAHRGRFTRIIDLQGRAVLPGFVSAHWHMPFTLLCDWADASAAATNDAMLAALISTVHNSSPGEWLVLRVGIDPTGTMHSLIAGLDRAAPANPVLVTDGDGNIIAGNTLAGAAGPLPAHVSALLGRFAERLAISRDPLRARLAKLLEQTAAAGVTCLRVCGLGALTGQDDLDLMRDVAERAPRLRLRGTLDLPLLSEWNSLHLRPGFGDDMFRIDTVSAWIGDDEEGRLVAALRSARAAGWSLTLHATGESQMQTALTCFDLLRSEGSALDRRCGIECEHIPTPEQLDRLRLSGLSLGLTAADSKPTPVFKRCDNHVPVTVSLGMDMAVGPSPPLRMLTNARNLGLSLSESLAALTIGAARRCGVGDILGSLEPGKYADFVFLDRDPRTVDRADLASVQCLSTWVNGQEAFRP